MTVEAAQTGLKPTSKIKILGRIWCPESRQKKGPRPVRRLGRYTHPQVAVFCGDVGEGAIYSFIMVIVCVSAMHVWYAQTLLPRPCVSRPENNFQESLFPSTLLVLWYILQAHWPVNVCPVSAQSPCFCFLSLRGKAGITDVCQS